MIATSAAKMAASDTTGSMRTARARTALPLLAVAAALALAWTTACAPAGPARAAAQTRASLHRSRPLPWSDERARRASPTTAVASGFSGAFDDGRADFVVEVQGVESSYRTTAAFVLPGEQLTIRVTRAAARVQAAAETGRLRVDAPGAWTWTAPPTAGAHSCIRLTQQRSRDSICVKTFVMQPYHGQSTLDGFRIGHYPRDLRDGDAAYLPPRGLVRVSADNIDEAVSPHFRLGQFLCKQDGDYPKFLALKTALVVKLEILLEKLAAAGVVADTLHVMSGYRTPFYNAAIGNLTSHSRHSYGDAADVYVDRDADGVLDDLDGDGRSSIEDARWLYRLMDGALDAATPGRLEGGLAAYPANLVHGPFVHVDTRGHRARW